MKDQTRITNKNYKKKKKKDDKRNRRDGIHG